MKKQDGCKMATISFRPTENDGGMRRKILEGFGDRVYYYITHLSARESKIFHGLAVISSDYKHTSMVIRLKGDFEYLKWLPSINNLFLFSTDKISKIEPLSETKYEKPFFVADGQIHMPLSKNIEPIVEHLKPGFWSISYADIDLPPVDKSGDLNLLKNIILDCMQHLNLSEEEKKVLLFAIDLGWPETDLVNWKNYRIIGNEGDNVDEKDKKRAMQILDIYNEREFGKLLRAAIRKIIYDVSTSSKAAREDALEVLKAGITPNRPHPKLKVLDALFASYPAQDYMERTYHAAFKKSLLKFKLEKNFVSFIRSIPQDIEKETNEVIKRKFAKVGWKVEKVERTDEQNRFFRFHVSCTFDDPKTIDEEKIVNAFYDTLKEIYSYNTLKNRLEEVFYTKRKIWIKGVKLTVTFTSATPIEPLKRSLTQHFGLYLYPHRGPEFGVIPYQTDFEEYSLNGLRKLNLYLYFPRPYDFLFDVKKELPFELDDKTRQAVDYCYLGRFHEAKTFLDMGIGGLTADKYILVGGRWNIDKAKEIYENLGIDFNAKDLNTPKYFIYSDLDEIKMLREVNRLVSESVDLFIESKDMERDAFEGDKVMEDIILREAQRLRERAYLPYPSNITALIFILQALSREVKNDMKKVM